MMVIDNLISCLFSGFQITVVVLFILKLSFKKHELFWKDLFLLSNCILLVTSLVYGISYGIWLFEAWYSQVTYVQIAFKSRVIGPYCWSYWSTVLIPFVCPQVLWIKKFRRSFRIALLLIPFLSLGIIYERILIIVTGYYRDYLPSSWTYYAPNLFEFLITCSVFSFLLMLIYFIFRKR